MQVFVTAGGLAAGGFVPIYGAYPDTQIVKPNQHGDDKKIIRVPDNCVVINNGLLVINETWRTDPEDSALVVDYEANRRIQIGFSNEQQRKANALMNSYITQYGADSSVWPVEARDTKATIDSGYQYIKDVNQNADAMKQGALPTDPTDNAHWPPPITPIVLP